MHDVTDVHRLPFGGSTPIDTPYLALSALSRYVHSPLVLETLVLTLDPERRPTGLLQVAGRPDPEHVVGVVEHLAACAVANEERGGVVIATVRPRRGAELTDVERWIDLDTILGDAGIELLEWWVIGDEVVSPRDLLGEAPRWST